MMTFDDFKDLDDNFNVRLLLIKQRKSLCQQVYDNRVRMMERIIEDESNEFPNNFFDTTFIQVEQELKDEIFKNVFEEFIQDLKE